MTKSGTQQIDLFVFEAPCAPERSTVFDKTLAEKWKKEKIAAAASSPAHQKLLTLLRPALVALALTRPDRCVCADDAQRWLIANGYKSSDLANAAGSIFRNSDFELTGYRPSERASRHRNLVGVWRLKTKQHLEV